MIRQPIKLTLIVENIVGFYRNYSLFGKMDQSVIMLRTVVEIVLILSSFYFYEGFLYFPSNSGSIYFLVTNIYSLIMLIITIHHSKKYKLMLLYFNLFMSYFPSDQIYSINTNRNEKKLMILFIMYNVFTLCLDLTYYCVYGPYFIVEKSAFIYWMYELILYIGFFRFLCEFFVINCFLSLMSEQIGCIIRSVNVEVKQRAMLRTSHRRSSAESTLQLVDKWSAAYVTVTKISKLCNQIFGFQVITFFIPKHI